jgi:type II secretory ATPase GspE/PulE/Tfp pilus assembly ATPase PilB-like protein
MNAPEPNNVRFLEALRALPHFSDHEELDRLVELHGMGLGLVQSLIDARLLSRDVACRTWADTLGVAYVDPFASISTEEAIAALPIEIARKAIAVGLYEIAGVLTLAMADPTNAALRQRLEQAIQKPISPVFALPKEIEDAIAIRYSSERALTQNSEAYCRLSVAGRNSGLVRGRQEEEEEGVAASFLNEMIHYSLRERATDLHLEVGEMEAQLRLRVDGNLRVAAKYSRRLHRAIVARLKILSNANIAESRFPQDGRFSVSAGGQTVHFRLSTIPTGHGEKAVIRVMAQSGRTRSLSLDEMLISQTVLEPLRHALSRPSGILFVTGPTGSGKTTTLYAALQELNRGDLNITTIEDPIEVQLPGISQSQTNAHIGLTFSTLLRSILRQDPDVILVGEIRDLETAKIATEAALTGHAVLATLHTNTAAQAVVRLIEMGVATHMVAPAITGVLAQRLAARICPDCKEAYSPSPKVLRKYFLDEGLADVPFYRGRGCPTCRGSGYKGRIAFHELVLVSEEIRTLIYEGRGTQAITEAAARVGHRSLRYDGLKKVLLGLTTIEEIEQNTPLEWAA